MAVLDLPKRINVLITFADGVVKAMTGNALLPSANTAISASVASADTHRPFRCRPIDFP